MCSGDQSKEKPMDRIDLEFIPPKNWEDMDEEDFDEMAESMLEQLESAVKQLTSDGTET
jgi:hypothetical protein